MGVCGNDGPDAGVHRFSQLEFIARRMGHVPDSCETGAGHPVCAADSRDVSSRSGLFDAYALRLLRAFKLMFRTNRESRAR